MPGGWHGEELSIPPEARILVLRRYAEGEPDLQFLAQRPFDGSGMVMVAPDGLATIRGLLVSGPALRRLDRNQIEAILRAAGAQELNIMRHHQPVTLR